MMTVQILRAMGLTDEEIIDKIVENSSISEENAARYVHGEAEGSLTHRADS